MTCVSKPFVYLACPYAHPEEAVRLARYKAVNQAAGFLLSRGVLVFSPISHSHSIAVEWELPKGWEYWHTLDRAYLEHCQKLLILRLDGWEQSVGIAGEIEIAKELGIEIGYMDMSDLGQSA